MAMKDGEIFRMTPHPSPLDECKGRAGVERIVPNRNLLILHHRRLEAAGPVVNTVDLDAAARRDFCRALWRGGQCSNQDLLIVWNHALRTNTARLESGLKRFPWTPAQRWVVDCVVDLEKVLRKARMQFRKRPGREFARIHGFRHLADVPCDLRVPLQIVNEPGICGSEETLATRSKPRFRRRPRFLDAFVSCQQSLEVCALEFRAAVDHDNLGEPSIPPHALPQDHHARAVAGRVKGETQRKTPPGKGVSEQRHPRTAQDAASVRTDEFHVQLGMIDVTNFEWPVAVAGSCWIECPIEGFVRVGCPPALAFQDAFKYWTAPCRQTECGVGRGRDSFFLTRMQQVSPCDELRLLLERFVILLD